MPKKIDLRDQALQPGATRPAAARANRARRARSMPIHQSEGVSDVVYRETNDPESLATKRQRHEQALIERHEQRKGWFLNEAMRQAANRTRMAKCEAYYDNEQWGYQEAQDVRDRGQYPTVYNEIKPTIDWLIGTERRTRVDFVVMAEDDEDEADDDAQTKTKLLKWLDDTNMAQFERSYAAEDAFKAGIGWLEVGLRGDKSGPPILVTCERWRNILWDSYAQRRDLSDARYLFRVKVVDYDVALALFPEKKDELDRIVQVGDNLQVFSEWGGGIGAITGLDHFNGLDEPWENYTAKPVDMFNARKRVLLLECWERVPMAMQRNGEGLGDPVTSRIRVSIMTERDTLIEAWSPFKHDRFPFVPVWGYQARRTGLPYSPVWPLIGPQDARNHRMSKSVFEASSNRWIIEKDALLGEAMGPDQFQAEMNDPTGVAVVNSGAVQHRKIMAVEGQLRADKQLMLAEHDSMTIRQMSGVNADNRGEQSNAISGKAVLAKQDQGSLLTAELFDNLLMARKIEGELTLSLSEQFIVQPMTIRLAGDGMKAERIRINQPDGQGGFLNDITKRRAHFVVGEQAWKQAYAEAAFDSLFEVLSQLATAAPEAVINLLDLVFDMHPNLPKKRAIVARIRSINGQADPDGKLTPEQQAEIDKKRAIAEEQFRLQMAEVRAKVRQAEAQGRKLDAETIGALLSGIMSAAEAAVHIATIPEVAAIADELLKSAGFKDNEGGESIIDSIPTADAALAQQQQAMQQLPPPAAQAAQQPPVAGM